MATFDFQRLTTMEYEYGDKYGIITKILGYCMILLMIA